MKAVTFGEIMLRLKTPEYLRIVQAQNFEASYGIFPEMGLRIVEQCATLYSVQRFLYNYDCIWPQGD